MGPEVETGLELELEGGSDSELEDEEDVGDVMGEPPNHDLLEAYLVEAGGVEEGQDGDEDSDEDDVDDPEPLAAKEEFEHNVLTEVRY